MRHNNAEKIDLIFEVLVYKVNLRNKNRVLANSLKTLYFQHRLTYIYPKLEYSFNYIPKLQIIFEKDDLDFSKAVV